LLRNTTQQQNTLLASFGNMPQQDKAADMSEMQAHHSMQWCF